MTHVKLLKLIIPVLLVAATGIVWSAATHKPPTAAEIKAAKQGGTRIAVIDTVKGKMTMELYGAKAPITVASFIKLAKAKYFDGLKFHRVVPNFVIQDGDPTGTGGGGPGYTIKDEKSGLLHDKGSVGMAKPGDQRTGKPVPNSAGSQYYICLSPAHFLDADYTVFAKVVKGMEVAPKIQQGDKIKSITILPKK